MKRNFKRVLGSVAAALLLLCFLGGCGKERNSFEKIKDLEFTVLAEENIPEELKKVIEEKKKMPFKLTYQDNGFLYICIGYGKQEGGGYSITADQLYLTENAIYVDTTLIGPEDRQALEKQGGFLLCPEHIRRPERKNAPSCPMIVLKTEFIDKPVVFD